MTSPRDILTSFSKLNVWKRDGQRAPHKPLLVLYALARWQRGERTVGFDAVEHDVGALLRDFGPTNKTTAAYPFKRLENDGIWQVDAPDDIICRSNNKEPLITELRRLQVRAGFTPNVLAALDNNPTLVGKIAREILDAHFPESIHAEILAGAQLDLDFEQEVGTYTSTRRKRDPSFRPRIFTAYEYRCCVCGFDARLGTVSIALEAAHICWHQAGGPDVETNGLALCSLHHKALDLGAFTIDTDLKVLISDQIVGSPETEQLIHRFHGQHIRPPQHSDQHPHPDHLGWHRSQVFRGQPRHVG